MKRIFGMLSLAAVLAVTAFAQSSTLVSKAANCKACCQDKCGDCCKDGCTDSCCQSK